MPTTLDEIPWHIGKDAAPLDNPPYRAFFYWLRERMLLNAKDSSTPELEGEIARRKQNSEGSAEFKAALECLRKANGLQ
jgi:hypothetical protein